MEGSQQRSRRSERSHLLWIILKELSWSGERLSVHEKDGQAKTMLCHSSFVDPFSTEGLLNIPDLIIAPSASWSAFKPVNKPEIGIFRLSESKPDPLPQLESKLFQLDLQDVPLPDLDSPLSSATASDSESYPDKNGVEDEAGEVEDIWALPDVWKRRSENRLISWDNFLNENYIEPPSAYVSESGPDAFNGILHLTSKNRGGVAPRVLKSDILLTSLFELCMGRESLLFGFDFAKATFISTGNHYTARGLSAEATTAVLGLFIEMGNQARKLIELINSSRDNTPPNGSAFVSIASCAYSILFAIEKYLEHSRIGTKSLLQLQALVERPRVLVNAILEMLPIVKSGKNGGSIISELSQWIQVGAQAYPWMEDIFQEIFSRTLTPLFAEIEISVGLRAASTQICTEYQLPLAGQCIEIATLTSALPSEVHQVVQESYLSLGLLRSHAPDHQLLSSIKHSSDATAELGLGYSWDAISGLQRRAVEYELGLKAALLDIKKRTNESVRPENSILAETPGLSPFDAEAALSIHFNFEFTFNQTSPSGTDSGVDRLSKLVTQGLDDSANEDFSVELKPTPGEAFSFSLMPVLTAQHRLLSYSVVQLLFRSAQIRDHLELQARFQLLGDGMFASRLSHALFDSDQGSGEGRRNTGTGTGLRLQSRSTWPPASSELRLVLMGILSESMTGQRKSVHTEYSESISFSIRDLSEEDLESCRNAESIHALDFLRLQYKPPNTLLEAIITPASLRKYDHIFMHLLSLLRVQSVAQSLLREASCRQSQHQLRRAHHRFRVDIHHFISTLADNSQNVAIGGRWRLMSSRLHAIECSLDEKDYDLTLNLAQGLEYLRSLHEETLDGITRALFLSKRQAEVRTLLEELFGVILKFAALTRQSEDTDETMKRMHDKFRKGMSRFVGYLEAQSGSSTLGGSDRVDTVTAAVFQQLLTRLNFNGYWNKDR